MLEPEITTQPDAIERLFCKPFKSLARHEMDKETTDMLIRLLMAKPTTLEDAPITEEDKPFVYKLIEKRIKYALTFRITDSRLMVFLAVLCKSAGSAVMYLTYLQYWCKKNNVKELDLDTFGKRIFPMGFPSQEDMSELWDKTKISRWKVSDEHSALTRMVKCDRFPRMPKRRGMRRRFRRLDKLGKLIHGSDNLIDYQSAIKSIQFN